MESNTKAVAKSNTESAKPEMPRLNDLQSDFIRKQVASGKTLSEITNDFVKADVTNKILNNENGKYDKLHSELAKEQKETIKEGFRKEKLSAQAEALSESQKKAEAFYVSFRPILEFDFSPLVHKEGKDNKSPKEYKDRSYGIPLMVLMLLLLTVPYCAITAILALLNGVNAVFELIATFGKIARIIATALFSIFIMGLVIYGAIL